MEEIISATKNLIKILDESDCIQNLRHYKNLAMSNSHILNLISKYNNCSDNYEKMSLKKEIYQNEEYSSYMKYYNELFFYVMDINKRFRKYTKGGEGSACH